MSQSVMLSGQGQSPRRESNASAGCRCGGRCKGRVMFGVKGSNSGLVARVCLDANGKVIECPPTLTLESAPAQPESSAVIKLDSRVCLDANGKVIECPPTLTQEPAPAQPVSRMGSPSTDSSPCPCVARARGLSLGRTRAA
jgi:hypothetical protein